MAIKPKFFISYARVDNPLIQPIVEIFRRRYGYENVWYDQELHNRGGEDWWVEILHAIKEADIFVYLLSKESAESPYCRAEFEEAQRLRKRFIFIQVRDRTPFPASIANRQYIDMSDGVNDALTLTGLYNSIDYQITQIPPRPLRPTSPAPTPKPYQAEPVVVRAPDMPATETLPLDLANMAITHQLPITKPTSPSWQRRYFVLMGLVGVLAVVAVFVIRQVMMPPEPVTSVSEDVTPLAPREAAFATFAAERTATQAILDITLTQDAISTSTGVAAQTSTAYYGQIGIEATLLKATLETWTPTFTPTPTVTNTFTPTPTATNTFTPTPTATSTVVVSTSLLREFIGHTGTVWSVAFSPDGTQALSGSSDSTLRLWNTETGEMIRVLRGHSNTILSVAFSPDGANAVSSSSDGTVRLWDIRSGTTVRTYRGHEGVVYSVAFSPDNTMVLGGCFDKTLRLWNKQTGETIRTLRGHTGYVRSVAFSEDGSLIVSASQDGTVMLWNADSGARLRTFRGHTGVVYSTTISPDNNTILSGGFDKIIRLWDVRTGDVLRTFERHTSTVHSLAFTPDGLFALSGSADNTLRMWNLATGAGARFLRGHTNSVFSVAISLDGKYALSASEDRMVKMWVLSLSNVP